MDRHAVSRRHEDGGLGFGSDDYFALLAARPEWGKYFALGEKMIVLLDGVAYRVAEGNFAGYRYPAIAHTAALCSSGDTC